MNALPADPSQIAGVLSTDAHRIDPNIQRKEAIFASQLQHDARTGMPLFAKLELSLTGLCNRKCQFCPRSDASFFPNVNEHLSDALLHGMLDELAEAGWRGTISLSGFGEPLLHPKIREIVRTIHRVLPHARMEMVSNGDRLTVSMARDLFDAGLHVLILSLYDNESQLVKFDALRAEAQLRPDQMLLRVRYKPPEEHHGLTLSNRAGTVDLSYLGIEKLTAPKTHACYYPHYSVFVEYDGTVLLCCNDWAKVSGCGKVGERTLLDIWSSHQMHQVRSALLAGDRSHQPCSGCNIDGTLMGREHAAAWTQHYQATGEVRVN